VTGYGSITFAYTNQGRMSSATVSGNTFNYVYNPLGQLVKRSGPGITLTYFVYDEAGHLVGEYGNTGQLIQETVWLGDTPVATLRSNGSGGVDIYYVHTDHLNTPRKVTRPSDDKLRWRWDPDAFGNGSPSQNPQSLGNFVYNMRLPGQIYSPETGMNQNYFRDYEPAVGRYIQADPLGMIRGDLNLYAYAKDNPVANYDALGLRTTEGAPRPPTLPKCVSWPSYPDPCTPNCSEQCQRKAFDMRKKCIKDCRGGLWSLLPPALVGGICIEAPRQWEGECLFICGGN
jgi:RHS repeat-associated protein